MAKRKLELMPEILPTPQRAATSNVRARTMARLRVLATIGAGVAAACGGKQENSSSGGNGSSGVSPYLPPGSSGSSSGDPYGVVDPLPPPACFQYANPPTATARIVDVGDAGTNDGGYAEGVYNDIQIDIGWPEDGVVIGNIDFSDIDARLVDQKPTVKGATLFVRAPTTKPSFSIRVSTSCPTGPTMLTIGVTVDGGGSHVSTNVSFYGT